MRSAAPEIRDCEIPSPSLGQRSRRARARRIQTEANREDTASQHRQVPIGSFLQLIEWI